MGGARNGRILRMALALSVAVHLVLASFVHVRPVEAIPEAKVGRVIIHIYVHPKPTPTPHIVHQIAQRPSQSVNRAPRPPHVRPNAHGPVVVAPPVEPTGEPNPPGNTEAPGSSGATHQPGPIGPPAPACSDPNVEAKTLVAVSPEQSTTDSYVSGNVTAMIKVDLDDTGRVTAVSVYQSTGSMELDRAALAAARASSYAPETRDCRPVAGSYLFKVEFSQ